MRGAPALTQGIPPFARGLTEIFVPPLFHENKGDTQASRLTFRVSAN